MFFEVLESIIGNVWRLFTSITIPSTDIPFSAFVLALMLIRFSIWLFSFVAGGGITSTGYGKPEKVKRMKFRSYRRSFNSNARLGSGAKGIGSGNSLKPL